jgi:hypothetical protein
MAAKREDFHTVSRALSEYTKPVLAKALTLLRTETLYRGEKVISPAEWLHALHDARDGAREPARTNLTWRAVATAPPGFCRPRASMIGTLLEDIASDLPFEDVSRRFAAKMHPLQYQRPQSAPSAETIAQAEKLVATLNASGSLARRFARLDELTAVWSPTPAVRTPKPGVFGHLVPKGEALAPASVDMPEVTITWDKFHRTVVPTATRIEYFVKAGRDAYTTFVTAVNADAPPIFQWDSPERRNPVSLYLWVTGSPPEQFGLAARTFHPVSAVALSPWLWSDGNYPHQGRGVVFVLEGARDTRIDGGAMLFPEFLKSEFHPVRKVIEAFSRSAKLEGIEAASASGIMLSKGVRWDAVFRVTSRDSVVTYRLDRWD